MAQDLKRREPPPLPEKIEEWQRFLKSVRTINDLVEDVHRMLVGDEVKGPEYRALLRAVYDSQAVEGSLSHDNAFAAAMIREKARTLDGNELANEKTDTISKALGVVMRRYHASRTQRRLMLEGEIVSSDDGNNNS